VSAENRDRFYKVAEESSLMKRIGYGLSTSSIFHFHLMTVCRDSDDIANLASFLASDDARNITGSIFVSDSGTLINPTSGPAFKPGMYENKD